MNFLEHLARELRSFSAAQGSRAAWSRGWILDLLSSSPAPLDRTNYEPGHVTGSALVLSPDDSCVLLVLHQKLGRWLQPGGHVESSDRRIVDTARREACEETCVRLDPRWEPFLINVDVHEIPARKDEPFHLHHDLIYLFRAASTTVTPTEETPEIVWCPITEPERCRADGALSASMQLAQKLRHGIHGTLRHER